MLFTLDIVNRTANCVAIRQSLLGSPSGGIQSEQHWALFFLSCTGEAGNNRGAMPRLSGACGLAAAMVTTGFDMPDGLVRIYPQGNIEQVHQRVGFASGR